MRKFVAKALKGAANIISGGAEEETSSPVQVDDLRSLSLGIDARQSIDGISVNRKNFPILDHREKPSWDRYVEDKAMLIAKAFDAVEPYYKYLCSMDGMRDNVELQRVMEEIIKRYIEWFWDLKSSKQFHHSEPWDGLIHSLDTSCREAEVFLAGPLFGKAGIDGERTRKDKCWQVFAGFLVGILHDVGKLFDVQIRAEFDGKSVPYLPLRGPLLQFKLKHPPLVQSIIEEWTHESSDMKPFFNMMFAWTIVPITVYQQMPHDLMIGAMRKLLTYESLKSDRDSVHCWVEKDAEGFFRNVTRSVGEWFSQKPEDFRQGQRQSFWKIDPNWYFVTEPAFFRVLGQRVALEPTTLIKTLIQKGYVPSTADNHFYRSITLLFGDTERTIKGSFVRAELIDAGVAKTRENPKDGGLDKAKNIKIHVRSRAEVDELMDCIEEGEGTLRPDTFAKIGENGILVPAKGDSKKGKPKVKEEDPQEPEVSDDVVEDPFDGAIDNIDEFMPDGTTPDPDSVNKEPDDQGESFPVSEAPEDCEEDLDQALQDELDGMDLEPEKEPQADEEPEVESEPESETEPAIEEPPAPAPDKTSKVTPQDKRDQSINVKQDLVEEKESAFYIWLNDANMDDVMQALGRFVDDVGRGKLPFQSHEKAMVVVDKMNGVYFQYPHAINQILDIPAGVKLTNRMKNSRKKLLTILEQAGILNRMDGEMFVQRRLYYRELDDKAFKAGEFKPSDHTSGDIVGQWCSINWFSLHKLSKQFYERVFSRVRLNNHYDGGGE